VSRCFHGLGVREARVAVRLWRHFPQCLRQANLKFCRCTCLLQSLDEGREDRGVILDRVLRAKEAVLDVDSSEPMQLLGKLRRHLFLFQLEGTLGPIELCLDVARALRDFPEQLPTQLGREEANA